MSPDCTVLDWDTEFFGRRIGRINHRRLTPERVQAIVEWSRAHDLECLYFLTDPDDLTTVRLAEENGFRLVDIRMTFQHSGHPSATAEADFEIRPFQEPDLARLRAIARHSYTMTRFYVDPGFAKERCSALYETWIAKSCDGWADAVLVADTESTLANHGPMGFVTCHLNAQEGSIGLIGVAQRARGRGVAARLVDQAVEWLRERNAEHIEVVTQGRNVAAQRLYQRCGFRTYRVELSYHLWPDQNGL